VLYDSLKTYSEKIRHHGVLNREMEREQMQVDQKHHARDLNRDFDIRINAITRQQGEISQ
jgi:hypothetical protein